MKFFFVTIVAVAAMLAQAIPAPASNASPAISIVPITTRVAVIGEKASCNQPAAVNGVAYFEMPEIALEQGVTGTAGVKIDITSTGNLAKETLSSSSGNPWLDRAALLSARMTKFTPEVANCEHVGGSYLYDVAF